LSTISAKLALAAEGVMKVPVVVEQSVSSPDQVLPRVVETAAVVGAEYSVRGSEGNSFWPAFEVLNVLGYIQVGLLRNLRICAEAVTADIQSVPTSRLADQIHT